MGSKKIEDNEKQTAILQCRAIRLTRDLPAGQLITKDDLEVLRPCPVDGLPPYRLHEVLDKKLRRDAKKGEHLKISNVE